MPQKIKKEASRWGEDGEGEQRAHAGLVLLLDSPGLKGTFAALGNAEHGRAAEAPKAA
jgi:hypothetical protein